MPLKLNSSGGGSVTFDVPSTASDFTLTAPAATATLITTSTLPWRLLNTLTASSSAALSDTSNFTSSYTMYAIVLQNILPATNAVSLRMTLQSGGSFQSSSYSGVSAISNNGTIGWSNGGSWSSNMNISGGNRVSNTALGGVDGIIYLPNPSQTASYKQILADIVHWDSSTQYTYIKAWGAWRGGTGAITGVQFDMSSGNIASGTIRIYGII